MDLFIADMHFGHKNILRQCRPQFQTIEEMNTVIIENINRKMTKKDTLYILGDFAFKRYCRNMKLKRIKSKSFLCAILLYMRTYS